jgi:hypothetical protein
VIETMDDCCVDKAGVVERLPECQADTLRLVLLANAAMFIVDLISGLLAGSVALLADSLDMLGDTLVYGFSRYVVARGPIWKARAAPAKAAIMALFGMFVISESFPTNCYSGLAASGATLKSAVGSTGG